jgi:dipeptidyl aminopeptidase/acylaminoacyl peptidase
VRGIALAAALLLCAARATSAQLPPNEDWRTLHTRHFRVHFTPPLEDEARRAAVNAERAYAELSTELVPPRGTIELVVSDNVDYVNGYATPFPSNRIVLFAHPPTDASGLRNYVDWNALVVTHELTHIFHLDRSRGFWRGAQAIFGRNPLLFPNLYEPSWVLEGLAVYYESRLTGVGRLESSEHSMIARAAALADRIPTLQELSPGTSRFPGGEVVYVYGSLLFDYLSRTRGPASIRDFVERGAKTLFPFFLTATSRGAFGESFQTAWQHWRDSLVREMKTPHQVMPAWEQVTPGGRIALFPRWLGDTALLYAGDKGREMPAAYEVSLNGREKNLGRRNGVSPNVRLADGSILFSQPDYLDPYHVRQDLYLQRGDEQIRLTRGARLSSVDVRADGEVVAVQDVPATTRLVRISSHGGNITPITSTSIDAQWIDPRWSPQGSRIVAVEQARGISQIVVLDENGGQLMSFGASRSINSQPSWSPDGARIYFSSERNGMPQVYVADLTSTPIRLARLTDAATGVFSPEVSPDNTKIATVLFLADGDHIGIAPTPQPVSYSDIDSSQAGSRAGCANCVSIVAGLPPLGAADTSRATRYSPWLSLLPRYWLPVFGSTTTDGSFFGAATSGYDVIGRHDYEIEVLRNTRFHENSAWLFYRYAGLGLPLLDLLAAQDFSHDILYSGTPGNFTNVGDFIERDRIVSLQATFVRPRFRTYSIASIGGEIENFSYSTAPDTLLRQLSSFYTTSPSFPAIVASVGWSNAQRPELSISAEDGISASLQGRQRWQSGTSGSSTRSVVGVSTLYKSLDLPGFAHHVLALRGAVGLTDERSPDRFSAGGISGTSLEVFPGVPLGEERRTFGVRGYPAGAEGGIRAYSAALEYRAPLGAPSRGFRFIPVFIDKTSLTLFGEAGRAFCPASASASGTGICRASDASNPVMTSAGAELNLDTGLQLDIATRIRLGVAFPLANRALLRAPTAQLYGTFGASF